MWCMACVCVYISICREDSVHACHGKLPVNETNPVFILMTFLGQFYMFVLKDLIQSTNTSHLITLPTLHHIHQGSTSQVTKWLTRIQTQLTPPRTCHWMAAVERENPNQQPMEPLKKKKNNQTTIMGGWLRCEQWSTAKGPVVVLQQWTPYGATYAFSAARNQMERTPS